MFKIGDFSKLSRVSVRMLRYYDENDIFKPELVDEFTGYRYYSAYQIHRITTIVTLRDFGFNVLEIGEYLSADKGEQEIMLQIKKAQISDMIQEEHHKLNRITSAINNLFKENINMEFKVEIKKLPSYKMIALRDKISSYTHEGMLWGQISEYAEKNSIAVTGKCYATYYDTEYQEGNVDVEVLMEVKKMGKDDGKITFRETERVEKAACVLVPGEYSNISLAFEFLGKWMQENNKEIAGLMRQEPIKGPWNESDSKNYLTEIQCPIK